MTTFGMGGDRRDMTIHKFDLALGMILGFFFGYFILAFVTEIRIDKLRPFLSAQATKTATERALELYKMESRRDESFAERQRTVRDEAIKKYLKRLDEIMDYKECK